MIDALEQPGHVAGKGSHDLQAFEILFHLFGGRAVGHIPILGGNHGHSGDREILVQLVKRCCGTAPAAIDDPGCGFEIVFVGFQEEEPIQKGLQRAVDRGVVYRTADDQTIRGSSEIDAFVHRVRLEDTIAGFHAGKASLTANDRFGANVKDLRLDLLFVEFLGDLG